MLFSLHFDVPEKLSHVFSSGLWSRSSLRLIVICHSAPIGHIVPLHMSGFHVAALDALFEVLLKWAWRINALCTPANLYIWSCTFNVILKDTFSFTLLRYLRSPLITENNPRADPVSCAPRTTREHQSMYTRQGCAFIFKGGVTLAALKISKQMRVALSSQGFQARRNNRQ